jgi:hypothetical protein
VAELVASREMGLFIVPVALEAEVEVDMDLAFEADTVDILLSRD